MKTVEMLINEIKSSEILQKLLAEAAKNNTVAAFLADQGCEASAEELIAALKAQATEMNEDDLDAVAGGANLAEALYSICSAGLLCAIQAINSALGGGHGNGSDGRILCNDDDVAV